MHAILNIQENGANTGPKNQLKIQCKIYAQAKISTTMINDERCHRNNSLRADE